MSEYSAEQLDFFDSLYPDSRSELEKENEELKNLLMGYASDDAASAATEKLLMNIVRKMGRFLSDSNRKRIVLSSFYTLNRSTDEATFENVLNARIHDFNLRCHDWDEYYAERKSSRRRR